MKGLVASCRGQKAAPVFILLALGGGLGQLASLRGSLGGQERLGGPRPTQEGSNSSRPVPSSHPTHPHPPHPHPTSGVFTP